MRQTALEQQQQAEQIALQRELDEQRQSELKAAEGTCSNSTSGIPVAALAAPTNTTTVTTARQSSVVPGDSDADDEVVAVNLGKKKSRDRIEPPGFTGLLPCALIDTLNGTKQDYEVLRNEAAGQLKQQHQVHVEECDAEIRINRRNNAARVNPVLFTSPTTRSNQQVKIRENLPINREPEFGDFNSEIDENDENIDFRTSDAMAENTRHVPLNGDVLHSEENTTVVDVLKKPTGFAVEETVETDFDSHSFEVAVEQNPKLSDSDSADGEGDARERDDQRSSSGTPRQPTAVRTPRSSLVGASGAAVIRSGSGHSNDVLLGEGAEPSKSPRQY